MNVVGFNSLGSVFVNIGAKLDGLNSGIKGAERKLSAFSNKMAAVGTKLTAGITLPLTAVGTAALSSFSKIEKGMRNVNTIAKQSETQLRGMTDELFKLSIAFGQKPAEMTTALYNITSASFKGAEGLKVLESAARAAVAGVTTTESAAKAITGVLNAYGLSASEAGNVSDALFKTVEKGVVTFEELSQYMGSSVATARAAGVSYDELFSTIATMTRGGIESAEAFTSINMAMLKLIEGGKGIDAAMNKIGYESSYAAIQAEGLGGVISELAKQTGGDAKKIQEMGFQVRAFKAIASLAAEGGRVFAGDLEALANKAGATEAAFREQGKSFEISMRKMAASIQYAAYGIGELLAPGISRAADLIKNAAKKFAEMDKKTKKFIVTVAKVAAAVGPVLLLAAAFAKINLALGALAKTPLAWGLGLVLSLGAAIVHTYGEGNTFIEKMNNLIKRLGDALKPMLESLSNLVQNIRARFAGLVNEVHNASALTTVLDLMSNSARTFIGWINTAITKLAELGNGGTTLGEKLDSAFRVIIHGIARGFVVEIPKAIEIAASKISEFAQKTKVVFDEIGTISKIVFENIAVNIGIIFDNLIHNLGVKFNNFLAGPVTKEIRRTFGIAGAIAATGNTDKETVEPAVQEMLDSYYKERPIGEGLVPMPELLSPEGEGKFQGIEKNTEKSIDNIKAKYSGVLDGLADKVEGLFKNVKKSAENAKKSIEKANGSVEQEAVISAPVEQVAANSSIDDFAAIRDQLGLGGSMLGSQPQAMTQAQMLSSKGHNIQWFNRDMGWDTSNVQMPVDAAAGGLSPVVGGVGSTESSTAIKDGAGRAVNALQDIGSVIVSMAKEFEIVRDQVAAARA